MANTDKWKKDDEIERKNKITLELEIVKTETVKFINKWEGIFDLNYGTTHSW